VDGAGCSAPSRPGRRRPRRRCQRPGRTYSPMSPLRIVRRLTRAAARSAIGGAESIAGTHAVRSASSVSATALPPGACAGSPFPRHAEERMQVWVRNVRGFRARARRTPPRQRDPRNHSRSHDLDPEGCQFRVTAVTCGNAKQCWSANVCLYSSRKSTSWWASESSPGRAGREPPPTVIRRCMCRELPSGQVKRRVRTLAGCRRGDRGDGCVVERVGRRR